jgi:hypothetical protein
MILWVPESGKSSTKAKWVDLQNWLRTGKQSSHSYATASIHAWPKHYGARMGYIKEACA